MTHVCSFDVAFFKRLLIDYNYNVTGELAEPFETLLSEEIRQAAARRAETDLTTAMDEVFRERAGRGVGFESRPVSSEVAGPAAALTPADPRELRF